MSDRVLNKNLRSINKFHFLEKELLFVGILRISLSFIFSTSVLHVIDCYVKITYSVLNKVHKVKKTSVQKATSDPIFNQTIEFKIDKEEMEMSCLNFDVFHNTPAMVKHDKPLGSFIVGGALCARGKELEHWQNMTQKPQTVVKEWHELKI